MAKEREKRERKKLDIERHRDKKTGLERQTEQEKKRQLVPKIVPQGPWREIIMQIKREREERLRRKEQIDIKIIEIEGGRRCLSHKLY